MIRVTLAVLGILALTACDRGANDERDRAAGQILPGSASDAMLQTDRLQAEAPLAKPAAGEKGDGAGKPGAKTGGTDPASTDPAAAPPVDTATPVATPTPETATAPTP